MADNRFPFPDGPGRRRLSSRGALSSAAPVSVV